MRRMEEGARPSQELSDVDLAEIKQLLNERWETLRMRTMITMLMLMLMRICSPCRRRCTGRWPPSRWARWTSCAPL